MSKVGLAILVQLAVFGISAFVGVAINKFIPSAPIRVFTNNLATVPRLY